MQMIMKKFLTIIDTINKHEDVKGLTNSIERVVGFRIVQQTYLIHIDNTNIQLYEATSNISN